MTYLIAAIAMTLGVLQGPLLITSFLECAGFLLTSMSCHTSAIAELLVICYMQSRMFAYCKA